MAGVRGSGGSVVGVSNTSDDLAGSRGWATAVLAVVVRPALWFTAIRQVFVLARRGWWHRPPFLPLPDPDYLAFRMQTAYGDPAASPVAADVVGYLRWCRAWPRVARQPH